MITKLTIIKITNRELQHGDIYMGADETDFFVYDSTFTDLSEDLKWNVNTFTTKTINNSLSRFIMKFTEDLTFFITDGTGETEVDYRTFTDSSSELAISLTTSGSLSDSSDANLPKDAMYDGYYIKYNHTTGLFEYGSPTGGGGATFFNDLTDVTFAKIVGNDGFVLIYNNTTGLFEPSNALVGMNTAISDNATAISDNATAISDNTTAIGDNTTAIGDNTTAIGDNTTAISDNDTALGTIDTRVTDLENSGGGGISDHTLLSNIGTKTHDELETEIGDNNTAITNLQTKSQLNREKSKEYTGFFDNENIIITYDSVARTITLSGVVEAYWRGDVISELIVGWESTAHPDTADSYFLYYNGTDFIWSLTSWEFYDLQIAYVLQNEDGDLIAGFREAHGLNMDSESHKEFHNTNGTYFNVFNGGNEITNIVADSLIATERRPYIGVSTIEDEDLPSTLPALTTNDYSLGYFNTSGIFKVTQSQTDIIKLSGNIPYYNKWNAETELFSEELLEDGDYVNVWLLLIPATSDAFSQKNRYIFIQGQKTYPTSDSAHFENVSELNLEYIETAFTECVITRKFTLRYKDGNWYECCNSYVSGTHREQLTTTNASVSSSVVLIEDSTLESPTGVGDIQSVVNKEVVTSLNINKESIVNLAGASAKLTGNTPITLTLTPTVIPFTTTKDSTNVDIFTVDDTLNELEIINGGTFQYIFQIDIDNAVNRSRTLYMRTRNKNTLVELDYMEVVVTRQGMNENFTRTFDIPDDTTIETVIWASGNALTMDSGVADFLKTSVTTGLEVLTTDVNVLNADDECFDNTAVDQYDVNISLKDEIVDLLAKHNLTDQDDVDFTKGTDTNNSGLRYNHTTENFEAVFIPDTYVKEKHITIDGATLGDELFWFVFTGEHLFLNSISHITDSSDTVTFSIEDNNTTPTVILANEGVTQDTLTTTNINTTINPSTDGDRIFKVIANTTFSGQLHITLRYTDNLFYGG